MFKSADDFAFKDGHVDLSVRERQSWSQYGPGTLTIFSIGDAESGPVFVFIGGDPSGQAVDMGVAMGESFTHLHRCDTFRMSLDGDDMLVGRTIYGVGDYRLQEAGKWYGPEGPGPRHASGEVGMRMLLCFAGEPTSGSLFLTAIAPPGASAMPRSTWATEVMTVVVVGSCSIDGTRYVPGDIRIQEAGVPHPEITHGDDELQVMVVVGDRRLALPTVDEGDSAAQAWVDDYAQLLERVDLVSVAA
jgi:hypothetical protein